MSEDTNNNCCNNTGCEEPPATRSTAPIWIIVVTLVVMFGGCVYFDRNGGWFDGNVYAPYTSAGELDAAQPKSGDAAALMRGRVVYESVCGICHGSDGAGKPAMAPPLAGSEWVVTKGANRLIRIPLAGMTGPIQVAGKDWNLPMAAMGAALPDEDLAAVITYIRTSWGNKASAVTAADVAKVRAELGKNPPPQTAEQLKALPE